MIRVQLRTACAFLVSLAACSGAPRDVTTTDIATTASPAATSVAPRAPRPITVVPVAPSACVRKGLAFHGQLRLGDDPSLAFAKAAGEATVRLSARASTTAHVRVATRHGAFEAIGAIENVAMQVRSAFEGWAVTRSSSRHPIRGVRAAGDALELTLQMPAGLQRVDGDTVLARCEELVSVDPADAVPTSPGQSLARLDGAAIPLARTPGGTPVARVEPSRFEPCGGTTVLVEARGDQSLVVIRFDGLDAYGWVPSRNVRPAPPSSGLDPCGFGMIGMLSRGEHTGPPPGRIVTCNAPVPIAARVGRATHLVSTLDDGVCLRVLEPLEGGFDRIVLEGSFTIQIEGMPGATFLAPRAALDACETVSVEADGIRPWTRCDS